MCLLVFLSSRKHIRPLPDCRFLQNAAGCLRAVKWIIMMLMSSLSWVWDFKLDGVLCTIAPPPGESHRLSFSSWLSCSSLFSKADLTVWGALRNARANIHLMKTHSHSAASSSWGNLICAHSHPLVALWRFFVELCCFTVKEENMWERVLHYSHY